MAYYKFNIKKHYAHSLSLIKVLKFYPCTCSVCAHTKPRQTTPSHIPRFKSVDASIVLFSFISQIYYCKFVVPGTAIWRYSIPLCTSYYSATFPPNAQNEMQPHIFCLKNIAIDGCPFGFIDNSRIRPSRWIVQVWSRWLALALNQTAVLHKQLNILGILLKYNILFQFVIKVYFVISV